jgi:ribosome-associated protein
MEDLPVTAAWTVPAAVLQVRFARGGGPGGQSVNKLNTKAELRVRVADLAFPSADVEARFRGRNVSRITAADEFLIASHTHRSQAMNVEECRELLQALLRAALVAPRVRRPTRPTRASKERRLEEKRHRSERNRDRRLED